MNIFNIDNLNTLAFYSVKYDDVKRSAGNGYHEQG